MWHKDRRLGVLRGCPTWKPPLAEIRGCWIYSQPFLGATNPPQNPHWLSSLRVFAWITFLEQFLQTHSFAWATRRDFSTRRDLSLLPSSSSKPKPPVEPRSGTRPCPFSQHLCWGELQHRGWIRWERPRHGANRCRNGPSPSTGICPWCPAFIWETWARWVLSEAAIWSKACGEPADRAG